MFLQQKFVCLSPRCFDLAISEEECISHRRSCACVGLWDFHKFPTALKLAAKQFCRGWNCCLTRSVALTHGKLHSADRTHRTAQTLGPTRSAGDSRVASGSEERAHL